MSACEVVDAKFVESQIGKMPIVDVRDQLHFDTGHIPGAIEIRLDVAEMTSDPASELAEMFQDAGIAAGDAAIVYCGAGAHAKKACELLAQQGYSQLKLYEGGMQDWTKDPARPVETTNESFEK